MNVINRDDEWTFSRHPFEQPAHCPERLFRLARFLSSPDCRQHPRRNRLSVRLTVEKVVPELEPYLRAADFVPTPKGLVRYR